MHPTSITPALHVNTDGIAEYAQAVQTIGLTSIHQAAPSALVGLAIALRRQDNDPVVIVPLLSGYITAGHGCFSRLDVRTTPAPGHAVDPMLWSIAQRYAGDIPSSHQLARVPEAQLHLYLFRNFEVAAKHTNTSDGAEVSIYATSVLCETDAADRVAEMQTALDLIQQVNTGAGRYRLVAPSARHLICLTHKTRRWPLELSYAPLTAA